MKKQSFFLAALGIGFFFLGIMLGLALSGGVVWGELEARLYTSFTATSGLRTLECPLMLAPAESGFVTATFDNPTDELVKPVIRLEVSHPGSARQTSQTLSLAPGATHTLNWTVGADDTIFSRLILVSVYQSQYRQLPSRLGLCSILVLGLFGLSGSQTFTLIFAVSILSLMVGGAMWLLRMRSLGGPVLGVTNAGGVLAAIMLAGMLSSLLRWWGLTLFCLALTVLMIGVIITEFILFPTVNK
jgi:hypothetical protein